MDRLTRREALRQYKERKVEAGIFAVRCTATGQAWVGASRNLGQQQNGIWFGLRLGSGRNPAMQAAWREHGADAFRFEVLEVLDDEDLSEVSRDLRLKAAEARWRDSLGAAKLV